MDDVPFNPAYPSLNDDISVRCRVSNVNGAPATTSDDRGVVVVWRWTYGEQTVNPWSRTQMEYVGNTDGDDGNGNGELYEGKLPKQENIGDIEYYFECNFDGTRYKPFDYALFNYKFWDGDNSENHSPRQCRKGDPEKGIRDFYARLRRYKSNLGAMFLNTDLQYDPIEMELIGDDVWRGMVPVYKWAKTTEDFTVYFSGTNTYRVGIDANGKKTYSIDDKARFWNEADSYAAIPTGGICAESAVEPYDGIMKFTIPFIGISGSVGKTTTKELIAACLRKKYNVVATEGNLNNHIGVPLTLLRLNSETQTAVIEMGASNPGEISALVKLACPSFGLVTNVGKAHLQGFGSLEGVMATKGELYDDLDGRVFYYTFYCIST